VAAAAAAAPGSSTQAAAGQQAVAAAAGGAMPADDGAAPHVLPGVDRSTPLGRLECAVATASAAHQVSARLLMMQALSCVPCSSVLGPLPSPEDYAAAAVAQGLVAADSSESAATLADAADEPVLVVSSRCLRVCLPGAGTAGQGGGSDGGSMQGAQAPASSTRAAADAHPLPTSKCVE
jgi:hypothetical protein